MGPARAPRSDGGGRMRRGRRRRLAARGGRRRDARGKAGAQRGSARRGRRPRERRIRSRMRPLSSLTSPGSGGETASQPRREGRPRRRRSAPPSLQAPRMTARQGRTALRQRRGGRVANVALRERREAEAPREGRVPGERRNRSFVNGRAAHGAKVRAAAKQASAAAAGRATRDASAEAGAAEPAEAPPNDRSGSGGRRREFGGRIGDAERRPDRQRLGDRRDRRRGRRPGRGSRRRESRGGASGAPPLRPLKNALASRSIVATSGKNAARCGSVGELADVRLSCSHARIPDSEPTSTSSSTASASSVKHRERAIERDQIGRDRLAVDAHEAHRKARRDFAGNARLEQADHALLLLAGADQQDLAAFRPRWPPRS